MKGFVGQQGPPGPTEAPLISMGRTSKVKVEERPPDHITVEEMRLDIASRVGPLRLHAGRVKNVFLAEGLPVAIALGKGMERLPTYIRVELVDGYGAVFIDLSTQILGSAILTQTLDRYSDVIILSGEQLYATAHQIPEVSKLTEIKVTEVII